MMLMDQLRRLILNGTQSDGESPGNLQAIYIFISDAVHINFACLAPYSCDQNQYIIKTSTLSDNDTFRWLYREKNIAKY